jgi:hypothetical protein
MIQVTGRIVELSERKIEVEYRTFDGLIRRIRILAPHSLQEAFLYDDHDVMIELEERR